LSRLESGQENQMVLLSNQDIRALLSHIVKVADGSKLRKMQLGSEIYEDSLRGNLLPKTNTLFSKVIHRMISLLLEILNRDIREFRNNRWHIEGLMGTGSTLSFDGNCGTGFI
jgi:hypothetical protein